MYKTNIDELILYPVKTMQKIADDEICVGLIVDKEPSLVTDEDRDEVLEKHIFDYQYVDKTTDESCAYVWIEAEIPAVSNKTIKNMLLYVTVVCHKNYMKIDTSKFTGLIGNRRDNLVMHVDKVLQGSDIFGIGKLKLKSIHSQEMSNGAFTGRLLTYFVPDFNILGDVKAIDENDNA